MNSIKYIEHAHDLYPSEFYFNHFLNRIEVQYVHEASLNDNLLINNKIDDSSIYVEYGKNSGETVCKVRIYFS